MVRFPEDLAGGLGPHEGLAAVVPAVDEGTGLDHRVPDRRERAPVDGLTSKHLKQSSTWRREHQNSGAASGVCKFR